MYKRRNYTYRRRTYRGRPSTKRYVARIARNVLTNTAETKCFTNALAGATVTSSWQWATAIGGLTQGTGVSSRVGSNIRLVALEYFVSIVPIPAATGVNGSSCRLVFYHNKSANGTGPATAEVFDSNSIITGRNVSYAKKYSMLDDITHQMVITSNNAGVTYAAGPAFFKCIRFPLRTAVPFGGNVGSVSDMTVHDFGVGYISDDANCCTITITCKVWFKDI